MAARVASSVTLIADVLFMPAMKCLVMIVAAMRLAAGSPNRIVADALHAIHARSIPTPRMVAVITIADMAVIILNVAADFTSHLVVDGADY